MAGIIRCFNTECKWHTFGTPDRCSKPLTMISECPDADVRKDAIKPQSFYFNELMGNECACGDRKKEGRSFCYNCYSSLPRDMQKALYKHIGFGYEEAYEEAFKYLEIHCW